MRLRCDCDCDCGAIAMRCDCDCDCSHSNQNSPSQSEDEGYDSQGGPARRTANYETELQKVGEFTAENSFGVAWIRGYCVISSVVQVPELYGRCAASNQKRAHA